MSVPVRWEIYRDLASLAPDWTLGEADAAATYIGAQEALLQALAQAPRSPLSPAERAWAAQAAATGVQVQGRLAAAQAGVLAALGRLQPAPATRGQQIDAQG